jgi:hypothetical protein
MICHHKFLIIAEDQLQIEIKLGQRRVVAAARARMDDGGVLVRNRPLSQRHRTRRPAQTPSGKLKC